MHNSIQQILSREVKNESLNNLLQEFSKILEEFVDFGTHILNWDIDNARGDDDQVVILLLFRNYLELIDSISILIKKSSIDPCKIILRTALETSLGLEYILREDTQNRAFGFLVCILHKEINTLKKHNSRTEVGKQFKSIFDKDINIKGNNIPTPENLEGKIKSLESLLFEPNYLTVESEYQRLNRIKSEKNPNWYRLFGGPKNIQELCNYLGIPTFYEIFYRNLSNSIHGNDIVQGKISESPNGNFDIFQIRLPNDAQMIVSTTLTISARIFEYVVEKRIPEQKADFREWMRVIYPRFKSITGPEQFLKIE